MNACIKVVAAVLVVLSVSSAWAWGSGHDTVCRCVLRKLPSEWQAKFKPAWTNAYLKAAHLPDHGDAKLFRPAELAWLKENCGLKDDMMPLHHGASLFGTFERLVNALRTGDDYSVFIYLATLSHAIADGAACNHDPILHLFNYTWSREGSAQGRGLPVLPKNGRSMPCDFDFVERDADTRAVLARRLEAMSVAEPPPDIVPEQVFALLDRWEVLSMECNNRSTGRIIDAGTKWYATGDKAAKCEAADALCDLGLWSVERTLYVFRAAQLLAARGELTPMPLTAKKAVHDKMSTNYVDILKRPMENDSFARPYFAEPERPSRVRVMYSPIDYGGYSVFSPNSRPFGFQIVGSLKRRRPELNASVMDARVFAREGLDPKVTPVIIVFRRYSSYRGFDAKGFERHLRAYAQAGGKVIWINGKPPAFLIGEEVVRALRDADRRDGYCDPKFPVPLNELLACSFAWTGPGEAHAWKYVHLPNNLAGWNWIGSPQWFDRAALPKDVVPLTELRAPEKTFLTGVAGASCAYLPLNAIFAYCLTDERPCLDPFLLRLDSAGETILLATLDLLVD